MKEARVPSGPIYSIKDIYEDPQFNARGMFETTRAPGGAGLSKPHIYSAHIYLHAAAGNPLNGLPLMPA